MREVNSETTIQDVLESMNEDVRALMEQVDDTQIGFTIEKCFDIVLQAALIISAIAEEPLSITLGKIAGTAMQAEAAQADTINALKSEIARYN